MQTKLSLIPLLATLVGCTANDDGPSADADTTERTAEASAASTWNPHGPYTKQQLEQLCNDLEWTPSTPPQGGSCTIEVRLTQTSFVTGQGVSEGRGEISATASADPQDPALPPTTETIPTQEYNPEQSNGQNVDLGTYEVAVGTVERVEVCVDFVEHDNGGANGVDDTATGCTTLVLRCSGADMNNDGLPDGAAATTATIGPVQLCGDNQCNGSVSAVIQTMAADADMDDVPNDEDFTPDICDEVDKGDGGIGLIVYYHFGDNWLTSLFQGIGTGIAGAYPEYDYVILVSDQDASNPMNINDDMFREADLVLPPTRDGLMDAMRDMTSKGYRFDTKVFSHGHKNGPDDADFETVSGDAITGDWLVGATEPDLIGTARGGVPLIAWWSVTCIAARQIDAWITIGGIAASGAVDVQFNANVFGNYFTDWANNYTYQNSVDQSVTATSIFAVETLIREEGRKAPFLCRNDDPNTPEQGDGPGTVLELNPCAEDFFNDSLGSNDARYNIEEVYDRSVSGAENMQISSAREFLGDTSVTFGAPGHFWP